MTTIGKIQFLLLFLLHKAYNEELELIFKVEGGDIEMGYCFGADYIVIYRSAPDGEHLLGNSSADGTTSTAPADPLDRVRLINTQQLLGMKISNLQHSDSGTYRRECWQNNAMVRETRQQLTVCKEKTDAGEITLMEDGGAELQCHSSYTGVEGTSIKWYREVSTSYKSTLLLDSKVSLDPLEEELHGVVEVRDGGASLHVPSTVLESSLSFICAVMNDENCLSFEKMDMPDSYDVLEIFASQGERVTLTCSADHKHHQWETPLGTINTTTKLLTSTDGRTNSDQLYILGDDDTKNYSLVIPVVSDIYSGEYLCFEPFLVVRYSLNLCPSSETRQKSISVEGHVELECEVPKEELHSVQWHHRGALGEETLIHDSKDKSIVIPDNLRGRATLSEDSSSLSLSGLTVKDAGMYWCVVLGSPEFLEDANEYKGNDEEEYDDDEDYSDGDEDWYDAYRCISKQDTMLTVAMKPRNLGTVLETEPTPDPPEASNITAYALGAGLAGLLLLAAVIGAVIAIKKRAKTSPKKRGAACGSGPHKSKDLEMKADPGCTEKLNPGDGYDA